MRSVIAGLFFALGLLGAAPVLADAPPAPPPQAADYGRADAWLCRPGRHDSCDVDLSATVIRADGSTRIEANPRPADPKIDCFYVYPTVSHDPGVSATLRATRDERRAARQQFARLRSVCRLYAPLYRQITATAMTANMAGHPLPGGGQASLLAAQDVDDAWAYYLAHDNHGRGVVLIGHSQGASLLRSLIQTQVDGKPIQRLLLSAILPGYGITAPRGRDVGGTFQAIPACRHRGQTGCVIAFNTFRATDLPAHTSPPAPDGQEPICVNPAALAGGAAPLKAYLSATGDTIIPDLTAPQPGWGRLDRPVGAPFVSLPGLLEGACVNDERGVALYVTIRRRPGERRAGDFVGDWVHDGVADRQMGLHLVDLDLVMGNLIDVIGAQAATHVGKAVALHERR